MMAYYYPVYIFDWTDFVLEWKYTYHWKDKCMAFYSAKWYSCFLFKGAIFICCKYENLDKVKIINNRLYFHI